MFPTFKPEAMGLVFTLPGEIPDLRVPYPRRATCVQAQAMETQ